MIVFWILILFLTVALALLLTRLFGVKVYNATEKIYKNIVAEEEREEERK